MNANNELFTVKFALDEAMRLAAAHCNRVHALVAIAQEMPEAQFQRLAGQHPDTLERDLSSANDDFQRLKTAYEAHCALIGQPAYAVYNDD